MHTHQQSINSDKSKQKEHYRWQSQWERDPSALPLFWRDWCPRRESGAGDSGSDRNCREWHKTTGSRLPTLTNSTGVLTSTIQYIHCLVTSKNCHKALQVPLVSAQSWSLNKHHSKGRVIFYLPYMNLQYQTETEGKTWCNAAGSKGKEKTKLRKHSQLEASLLH